MKSIIMTFITVALFSMTMSTTVYAAAAAVAKAAAPVAAAVTAIDYPKLSLTQGFNFDGNSKEPFGHLISLKIGSMVFAADISATHPLTKKKYNVVGIMSGYHWTSELKDPMKLSFNISTANRGKLQAMLKQPLASINVTFNYQIFTFDPRTKDYFVSLKSFTMAHRGIMNRIGRSLPAMRAESFPLSGSLQKSGNQLQIALDAAASTLVVTKPPNYGVTMGIAPPSDKEQDIIIGSSAESNRKLPWGRHE